MPADLDLLGELLEVLAALVGLAELLLDGLELLLEEVLALGLVDVALDLVLDLVGQLEHLELPLKLHADAPQTLVDVELLQELLLLVELHLHVAGQEVRQRARRVDVVEHHGRLVRDVRRELDDLQRRVAGVHHQRLGLGRLRRRHVRKLVHLRLEERLGLNPAVDLHATHAADDRALVALLHPQQLQHDRSRAHRVEVLDLRIVDVRVLLADQDDGLLFRQDLLKQPLGLLPSQRDRHDRARKQNHVPHRKHGRGLRDLHATGQGDFLLAQLSGHEDFRLLVVNHLGLAAAGLGGLVLVALPFGLLGRPAPAGPFPLFLIIVGHAAYVSFWESSPTGIRFGRSPRWHRRPRRPAA